MKVLFLTNIPSPYRVDFFNELGKRCKLTVLFERRESAERDKSWESFRIWNFKAIFLDGFKVGRDSAFCPNVLKFRMKNYDRIIVSNFSDPTGIFVIGKLKLLKIPYYLESDGGFPGNGKGLKEKLKRRIISGAKGYFSTATLHDQYYTMYGADASLLVRYPFSSVHRDDITTIDADYFKQKEEMKFYLKIAEPNMVVMIGQFVYRKGIDVLLKATQKLSNDIGVYIIGGQAPQEYLDFVKQNNLSNVHFIDFMVPSKLRNYYRASDLFVLPTREDIWGLVVNEALAQGIPVITTDRCVAGTEMIRNGENGYIVPVDDHEVLADKIKVYFEKANKQQFAMASIEVAKKYTIESMVDAHINYFEHN